MKKAKAIVDWLPCGIGRNSGPPNVSNNSHYYSAPAKFDGHHTEFNKIQYDLVINKIKTIECNEYKWLAEVWFRNEQAPHVWLMQNVQLDLFEGAKCVAKGTIVNDIPSNV